MAELVEGRAVEIDLVMIELRNGHRHEIAAGRIEGTIATDAEIGARRRDQRLGCGNDLALGQGRGDAGQRLGQPITLVDVKDGEPLEEGDLPCVIALRLSHARVRSSV